MTDREDVDHFLKSGRRCASDREKQIGQHIGYRVQRQSGTPVYRRRLTPFLKQYIEVMGWDVIELAGRRAHGVRGGQAGGRGRNINGSVQVPENMRTPSPDCPAGPQTMRATADQARADLGATAAGRSQESVAKHRDHRRVSDVAGASRRRARRRADEQGCVLAGAEPPGRHRRGRSGIGEVLGHAIDADASRVEVGITFLQGQRGGPARLSRSRSGDGPAGRDGRCAGLANRTAARQRRSGQARGPRIQAVEDRLAVFGIWRRNAGKKRLR